MSYVRKEPSDGLAYTEELGTGTADATTFLRGDKTWAAGGGGGTAALTATQIGFGSGLNVLTGVNTFWRDPADGTVIVGKTINDWAGQAIGLFSRTANDSAGVVSENLSTGTSAAAAFIAYAGSTDYVRVGVLGPNTNTYGGALSTPRSGFLTYATASAAPLVINCGGTADIIFATTNSITERLRVTTGGNTDVAALAAGGLVKAAAGAVGAGGGRLSIATAGTDYEVPLTFSTGLTRTVNTITANLSTGIAGGQSVIGGTAAGNSLTYSSTTNGTKGTHIWGTTAGLVFDEANQTLVMGTATPLSGGTAQINKSNNGAVTLYLSNPNTGTLAYTAFGMMDRVDGSNVVGNLALFGSGSTRGVPYTAGNWEFELSGGSGNMVFWVLQSSGDFVWYTGTTYPNPTERMRIANGGNVSVANLSAGGLVKATAATGVLAIASSSDVAGAITWPAATRILVSTGTGTAPDGSADFTYDTTNEVLSIGDDTTTYFMGFGNTPTGNYEAVRAVWSSSVWTLTSVKGGAGTVVRNMKINADTATLTLNGSSVDIFDAAEQNWYKVSGANYERVQAGFISAYTFGSNFWVLQAQSSGTGAQQSLALDAQGGTALVNGGSSAYLTSGNGLISVIGTSGSEMNLHVAQFSRASAAGMVADMHEFSSNLFVNGSTNVTTAGGVNAVVFLAPAYDGNGSAKTITTAATVVINGPPVGSNGVTITNKYGLWVKDGRSSFDGDTVVNGNGKNLGFFGSPGTTIQTPTGSRGGNAALASLLTKLANYGLIVDGTSA